MYIREATKADIGKLMPLNEEVQSLHIGISPKIFRKTDDKEISAWLLSQIDDDQTKFYVAMCNDKIVAYLTLKTYIRPENPFMHERRYAHIEHVCVHSKFRKSGVGRNLIEYAINCARKSKLDYVELDVWSENTDARAAFKNIGFVSSREQVQFEIKP